MKKTVFTGIATALITPLSQDGVDFQRFGELIDWQIERGIDALVICGTTGESATMTEEEHRAVIEYAIERIDGRVPAIAGTGSNNTAHAVDMAKFACKAGADALLVVTPYYNKATQNGLIQSFGAVADASDKPVIVYSVPSRTGVNITPETCLALSKHGNIAAIKEASGNISQIVEIASLVGDDMDIYSGNDDQIVPILSVGGKGCISVLSNVLPRETCEITRRFFAGDLKGAAELQLRYVPLVKALFSEVNPIPVKAAMAAMGWCEDYLRLPLTVMEEKNRAVLYECLRREGINV